jgi:hypothetical protein
MLNCYCQVSSSVIFRQYGVSQSECKIDRPRPGLPRVSPRPPTEALGTRLIRVYSDKPSLDRYWVKGDFAHHRYNQETSQGTSSHEIYYNF